MNLIIDTHTHTTASGHAYSTLEENIRIASEKGIKLLGITDHAPTMPGSASKIYFSNFSAIPRFINGVEIIMGAELNIIDCDGNVDLPEDILKKLDICIASLHTPCIKPSTINENTEAFLNAMENKYIHVLGHPGDPRYPIDVKAIVRGAKRTGTLLEMNNASLIPDGIRSGSRVVMIEILKECHKISVPVVLGTDAHFSSRIGDFEYIEKLLNEINFPEELVLNTNVEKFKSLLKNNV